MRTLSTLVSLALLTAACPRRAPSPAPPDARPPTPPAPVVAESPPDTGPPPPVITGPGAKAVSPTQGQSSWAVYLAQAKAGSPKLAAAQARARKLGLEVKPIDLNCDQPVKAKRTLKRRASEENMFAVAVYFEDEADARAFAAAADPKASVRKVTSYCGE
jgi:hypothetical protein